ncbi:hypothetical protein H5410_004020 [Solanum commersonii]|uniref:Uncharacterized protein n=1 Tax=Solanum commersonii TaxID=4109 RepID=A0A9J6B799_SOLCO|nr:hypothetical protein H5410_004020 [Solanum commersonii]
MPARTGSTIWLYYIYTHRGTYFVKLPNIAGLFTSWSRNSLNTSSGSIGLSNLHIESNGSEPNTPTTNTRMYMVLTSDRDNFLRLAIEPLLGYKYDLIMFHLSFIYLYFN